MKTLGTKLTLILATCTPFMAHGQMTAISQFCRRLLDRVQPSKSIEHDLNSNMFKYPISIADIEAANKATEAFLKKSNVEYREVSSSDAFALSLLDRQLSPDHPLYGKTKLFQIIGASGKGKAHSLENFLMHPDLAREIQKLNQRGTSVIVDPSLKFSAIGGSVSHLGTEVRISSRSPWTHFLHEREHINFINEVLNKMSSMGYFQPLKNAYEKTVAAGVAHDSNFEARYPFFHPDFPTTDTHLKLLREKAFVDLALNTPHAEYLRLLEQKDPLGYVIQAVRKGHRDIVVLDEIVATSKELDAMDADGVPTTNPQRLAAEFYQLSFKIKELDGRKRNPAEENYLHELMQREEEIQKQLKTDAPSKR